MCFYYLRILQIGLFCATDIEYNFFGYNDKETGLSYGK